MQTIPIEDYVLSGRRYRFRGDVRPDPILDTLHEFDHGLGARGETEQGGIGPGAAL